MKIIEYKSKNGRKLIGGLMERTQLDYADVPAVVDQIIKSIREKGDEALFGYTEKFDGCPMDKKSIRVTKAEIEEAYGLVDENLVRVIKRSRDRIYDFHLKQKHNSWLEPSENGEMLGQMIRPIERVGVYVPGGTAAYPSSVLMNIVPAKVAGVKRIIMCTPPGKEGKVSPAILVAADIAGADEIYKAGGAQAIGAMAFGTESIPVVDKIVGPGNIYVALAKKAVFGHVNIDSVAGPSEILIIADSTAKARYVAADLLSQAEHDVLSAAILVTTSLKLAQKVKEELKEQLEKLPRKEIAAKSLENYGGIIVTDNIDEACEISNQIAPEHLEICVNDPVSLLPKIQNAGAVFMGNYTPEPLGDYMAGPNHVLPTGQTARFFSPLNVDDFVKKTSLLHFDKNAFRELAEDVITFAKAEGLDAHANAIKVRM